MPSPETNISLDARNARMKVDLEVFPSSIVHGNTIQSFKHHFVRLKLVPFIIIRLLLCISVIQHEREQAKLHNVEARYQSVMSCWH